MFRIVLLILVASVITSCGSNKKVDSNKQKEAMVIDFSAGPPTFIYKTVGDFQNLVPVILSDDKSTIVSYPHPRDIYYKGELAIPVKLAEGFLLDNRGINANVAFISLTYEEYSKLESAPAPDSLFSMIVEIDPLVSLYNCGNRHQYDDEINQLNSIINNGYLDKCKKIIGK